MGRDDCDVTMRGLPVIAGLLLAVGCGGQIIWGQIKVDVNVVNVLCTVYDNRGALVTDLAKDDFEIRDNGKVQAIRYFARETDLPLTIALLVDVSGSVRKFLQAEKETAVGFFREVLRPQD